VAYSPTTQSAYLTPEVKLSPGTVYYVAVSPTVSDDQNFPNPGATLGHAFVTSFTVNGPGVTGSSPLTVLQTVPTNGTQYFARLGYGSVSLSEALNSNLAQSILSRFSVMLVPHTGGVTTGGSGYADVPVNAKLAFNPNTNQIIIVPTQPLGNSIYLFSLTNIKAANGDALQGTPVYSTFQLVMSGSASAAVVARSVSAPLTAVAPSAPAAIPKGPVPASSSTSHTDVRSRPVLRPRVVVQGHTLRGTHDRFGSLAERS
jgi:hypothetical protein